MFSYSFLQVKAVFLAANHLKMDRVTRICAQHLIKHLSVENCIEVRSLPGIARNKEFIQQVDAFIAKEVSPSALTHPPNNTVSSQVRQNLQEQRRLEPPLFQDRGVEPVARRNVTRQSELPLSVGVGVDQASGERGLSQRGHALRQDVHVVSGHRQFAPGLFQFADGRRQRHRNRAGLQEDVAQEQQF